MPNKDELALLETVLLILDNCSDAYLLLECNLGPYIKRAREIVKLIRL